MWVEWAVRLDDCFADKKCTETVSGWYLYRMLRCVVHKTKKHLYEQKGLAQYFWVQRQA